MPVRTLTTRTPASRGRRGRVLPVGDDVGEKPVAALAVLGEGVVAAVVSVVPDRRGGDQHGTGARRGFGQLAGRANSAVANGFSVAIGEAAGDRGAGQMDDRIDAGQ